MHQITFNTNHDFAPSILANGQVVFSRWDTEGGDAISLYVTIPTAPASQLYYGANSHATGANIAGTNNNVIQFLNARQRADGKLLAIARPFLALSSGGDIVQIDAENFVEVNQPSPPRRRRPGAIERHHAWRHHRREQAFGGRPLRFRVSALRWHQSDARELGSLPGPG